MRTTTKRRPTTRRRRKTHVDRLTEIGRAGCQAMGKMNTRPVITEDCRVELVGRPGTPSTGRQVSARYQPRGEDGRFVPYHLYASLQLKEQQATHQIADLEEAWGIFPES